MTQLQEARETLRVIQNISREQEIGRMKTLVGSQ